MIYEYCKDGKPGPDSMKLYNKLGFNPVMEDEPDNSWIGMTQLLD